MDNDSKEKLFYEMFFLKGNTTLTPPPENFNYPPPKWKFHNITDEQIHWAILKIKPFKVSQSRAKLSSHTNQRRYHSIPCSTLSRH
jgi:hypothetical protein